MGKDGVDFVGKKSNDLLHNKDHLVKWVLKKGIVSRTMAGATSLLLLAHTPVSRKVFQYFHCSEMGGKSFMRADYSIECLSAPWFAFFTSRIDCTVYIYDSIAWLHRFLFMGT